MKKSNEIITDCGGIKVPENNALTELVFILDKSGSMSGLEGDTIGGFNSMIKKQKSEAGKCFVSTVLFDSESFVLHDRVKLSEIPEMTEKDYVVGGCTALIDALGGAIKHISDIHKYARKEDIPQNTLVVITTDGQENSSHIYTSDKVKQMVDEKKEKFGWEFIFIGANIDAVETAKAYGINEDRAVNYNCDGIGTKVMFESVSMAVKDARLGVPVTPEWCKSVKSDYEKRGKNKRR